MRCVDWAAEYLDGHVVVAVLRAEGFDAHLFDEATVRQDWFKILAYGGFRVMVPAREANAARSVVAAYRDGTLALDPGLVEHPACPHCGDLHGEPDPRPRRRLFLAYGLWSAFGFALIVTGLGEDAILVVAALPWLVMLLVPLLRHLAVSRYRCPACAHAWRAAPTAFVRLRQAAETAGAANR